MDKERLIMNLPHLVNIKTKTNVDLGSGSFEETYAVTQTDVASFLQPKEIQDVMRAGRKINSKAYNCYFYSTVAILGDDRVEYDGDDYTVVAEPSWIGTYKKVYLEKII
jgi:hypothetical protein